MLIFIARTPGFNHRLQIIFLVTMAKTKAKTKSKKEPKNNKQKSKKKLKKIGLAKYLQPVLKPKKPRDDEDLFEKTETDKKPPVKKSVPGIKSDQKNLSLIDRCKLQMSSSLLRLIDEDLYTSDTKHVPLDKDKFLAYHDAYASVCDKWPTKPIDYIVKFIKKRLLARTPVHKMKFADIGCGKEPLLKMKLPKKAMVFSYDLVSTHEDIVEANMENLPLESGTIDCAVYSLSLMAKNLGSILLEAKRILKKGGSILIVEVTSRFEGNERRFVGKMERIGLKKKSVTPLKPNAYFTFFHFSKEDSIWDYPSTRLNIELKPCVYKAR